MDNLHSPENLQQFIAESRERLKELSAINQTTGLIKEGKSIEDTLKQLIFIIVKAYQYPEQTLVRITYDHERYTSADFNETRWVQNHIFETIDGCKGNIEVYYTVEFPVCDEGPFLEEERHMLNNIANLITGYINSVKAKAILTKTKSDEADAIVKPVIEATIGKQLLQKFLTRQNYTRDIYHDLMPFKVKEILIIATLYDAYSIEREGRFSEHILGEYYQLNLSSMPRVTGVSTADEAMTELKNKHYDMIIIMLGVDKKATSDMCIAIRKEVPYIPIYLLLNNNSDVAVISNNKTLQKTVDQTFVWNGDSKIFFAMVKSLEDKVNVENDTKVGLVGVIMLVEDSSIYFSRYLPILYSIVLEQTKNLIEEVSTDELFKIMRMRARPKILLAKNYEEALDVYNKYSDYLLCLITDVEFAKAANLCKTAGFELLKHIRLNLKDLPAIIQSSNPDAADAAFELKATFINKNSEGLIEDFKSFIYYYLGFGNFIYKNIEGREIAVARTLKEFESHLRTIPEESLVYHAKKNHFSTWLKARGEIQIAKIIRPAQVEDFKTPEELRQYLIINIQKYRNEQNKGKIVPYEDNVEFEESNIITLASGSLGGKGRGVSFINALIYNYDFPQILPNIHIKAPKTCILGTDAFEYFVDRSGLDKKNIESYNYEDIQRLFLETKFSEGMKKKLRMMLRQFNKPIAIRSSGLFEDSLMLPFAGIFETYMIPNNHENFEVRLQQLCDAIKLVYASIYAPVAQNYIKAINYKVEDEKMAVVIQEVVGNRFDDVFYPHISGVAQSYNYYPIGNMKPEEGFAVLALGLGKHVVEGEKSFRYSPRYPNVDVVSQKDIYKNSQVDFFAVDLSKSEINLLEGDTAGLIKLSIDDAERHGTIKHCASVYDSQSERIISGITQSGPRIINFANILKYNYIPLSKTIDTILDIVKESLGSPVEIEFAVDLNKDANGFASFYLLQIKPLIGNAQDFEFNINDFKKDDIVLFAEKGMGNGIIQDVYDLIYVDPTLFDKIKTLEMTYEIEELNKMMVAENRKYILIGPGRWGTRDKFIGIPVNWPQISNAKIIVETSLEGFPLDASLGSHFFHNVTSMNVGYFSVQPELSSSYIKWDFLTQQTVINQTTYFKHLQFEYPLIIRMDGKKRISMISIV